MNDTLKFYKENAREFVEGTIGVDMSHVYAVVEPYYPKGGRILDLGCGAGTATKYYAGKGYEVVPVDGCKEMCDATTALTGIPARELLFQDLDYNCEFDGVWACASLLHVPMEAMEEVLTLVKAALKQGGVLYASYKYGTTERNTLQGRSFTDYTEDTIKPVLESVGGFKTEKVWVTADARPERSHEKWLNLILIKI